MAGNALNEYLESKVLSASPVELVQILCRAVVESVENARRHLKERDVQARVKEINKAITILGELTASLNHEVGGEFSRTTHALYDYMMRRLVEANSQQSDPPLAEVSQLMATVLEGWTNCSTSAASPAAASPASSTARMPEPPAPAVPEYHEYRSYAPAAQPAYAPYRPASPAYAFSASVTQVVQAYTPFTQAVPPAPALAPYLSPPPAASPFAPPAPESPVFAYTSVYASVAYAPADYASGDDEAAGSPAQETHFTLSY